MVSKKELEALRQAYPDLPWPAQCDSAASGSWSSDTPQHAGGPAVEARPALAGAPR